VRVLGGKYRLIRQIASGGMGTVWLAEHTQLGTTLAVKLMAPHSMSTPALRTRFEREARSAAQLKGPNVVTIHDFGVDGDTPYIAMELLEGEDLGARLRRVGQLDTTLAAAIVDGAARALERAHALGIVHRDMKASNVFLSREGGHEVVKVLDFGVAKQGFADVDDAGDITSTTDSMIGSPSYMSPEQIRSAKNVDHRADLWAIAVLAYRMLTGQMPFQGEGRGDLLVKVCTEPFVPVRVFRQTLPATMDGFFVRALAKDAAARFQSARELSNAFSAALNLPPPAQVGALPGPPAPPVARREPPPLPSSQPSMQGGSFEAPPPVPAPPESGTLGAGSFATPSLARSRQASFASLVVVGAALTLGMVAALFLWRGSGDAETRPSEPRAAAVPAAPPAADPDPAAPSIEDAPVAAPIASASAAAEVEEAAPTSSAPSASSAARATRPPPASPATVPPPGGGRPRPAPPPAPTGGRLDLGL
jgi:serine/threonine protein kinase